MDLGSNELALYALARRPRFSWAKTRILIEELGSPLEVLRDKYSDQLLDDDLDAEFAGAASEVGSLAAESIRVTTLWSAAYPSQLREVHDAPPVIYSRGSFEARDAHSVAVVGTRQPDGWGESFAFSLGCLLAAHGIPVVSGLARGIDGVAMRGSLSVGGRTVGVIGTGLRRYYPAEHRQLQDMVSHHLLISQFAPDASPTKQSFPMRNVVMSGFASMTVVVQAGETSGTRIQAAAAVRHGRPLVVSDRVAERAEWARDLLRGGYDIRVVSSPEQALAAVKDVHEETRVSESSWGVGSLLSV